jgi:hypothetical protein
MMANTDNTDNDNSRGTDFNNLNNLPVNPVPTASYSSFSALSGPPRKDETATSIPWAAIGNTRVLAVNRPISHCRRLFVYSRHSARGKVLPACRYDIQQQQQQHHHHTLSPSLLHPLYSITLPLSTLSPLSRPFVSLLCTLL